MTVLLLTDLYRHMAWADAATWTSVLASPTALQDDAILHCLHHFHVTQKAFLRVWRGEPRDAPYEPLEDPAAYLRGVRECHQAALAHLESLGDAGLSSVLSVPWAEMVERRIGRPPGETTVGETALQVVLHSSHHRGQVSARLRAIGATPAMVDYIAWLWLGRPAPDWP
jgi:uncharacterized damage-inducible protein DinB